MEEYNNVIGPGGSKGNAGPNGFFAGGESQEEKFKLMGDRMPKADLVKAQAKS